MHCRIDVPTDGKDVGMPQLVRSEALKRTACIQGTTHSEAGHRQEPREGDWLGERCSHDVTHCRVPNWHPSTGRVRVVRPEEVCCTDVQLVSPQRGQEVRVLVGGLAPPSSVRRDFQGQLISNATKDGVAKDHVQRVAQLEQVRSIVRLLLTQLQVQAQDCDLRRSSSQRSSSVGNQRLGLGFTTTDAAFTHWQIGTKASSYGFSGARHLEG